eukprot:364247-Chlamydomonas_euryale.AAC.13
MAVIVDYESLRWFTGGVCWPACLCVCLRMLSLWQQAMNRCRCCNVRHAATVARIVEEGRLGTSERGSSSPSLLARRILFASCDARNGKEDGEEDGGKEESGRARAALCAQEWQRTTQKATQLYKKPATKAWDVCPACRGPPTSMPPLVRRLPAVVRTSLG